jgi:hypothetical protein
LNSYAKKQKQKADTEMSDLQERRRLRILEEIADAPHMPMARVLWFLHRLVEAWVNTPAMRTARVPLTYYNCMHVSQRHVGYPALVQAVVRIVRQTRGHHPSGMSYHELPAEERRAAIAALNDALAPYPPVEDVCMQLQIQARNTNIDFEYALILSSHVEFLEHQSSAAILHVHTPVLRPLIGEARFCPLLQDTLSRGALYTLCDTCKNAMDADAAETALQRARTCPLCRAPWTATTVYQNT